MRITKVEYLDLGQYVPFLAQRKKKKLINCYHFFKGN